MNDWQGVWSRLSRGEHVVLVGAGAVPRPDPAQLRLVVVDCEAFPQPRGALEEARRRVDVALGAQSPAPAGDAFGGAGRGGLRQNLLGEPRDRLDLARYFEAFVNVPRAAGVPVALMLRGVDRADDGSLALLASWSFSKVPKLPMLLSFESAEPTPLARRLLDHLSRALPKDGVWRPADATEQQPQNAASLPRTLRELPAPMLQVLRGAATLGDRFESEVLGQLLEMDELAVLSTLQAAVDRGLAIEDRGQGVFRFDVELARALRDITLPSLARAWHERLARLFGGLPAPLPSGPSLAAPVGRAASDEARARAARAAVASAEGARAGSTTSAPKAPAAPVPAASSVGMRSEYLEDVPEPASRSIDPRRDEWYARLGTELQSAPASAPARSSSFAAGGAGEERSPHSVSERRAAQHAEAAGLWDAACEQHLAAAEFSSRMGSHHAAVEHSTRAQLLAEQLGDLERLRRAKMLSALIVGRARWLSRSNGADATLESALEALLTSRALSTENDPLELRAELGTLLAGVQYDIGTPAALEQALHELTAASQLLLDAGRPLDAARLLNDEAAIWVKLGDTVRANHLLSRSREVFEKVARSHPLARVELAETEHLLARLLLHAKARTGRERDALLLGVEHGRAAEETYRELNDERQLGRVWETLARLHLRLGHLDVAARLLDDARRVQQQLGDGVGLARSSAAASEVLAAAQDYPRALERLCESVDLNCEKGLRTGLQFNLLNLEQLQRWLPIELQASARALEQRLSQALAATAEH